jgi:hypothetical protein
MEEVMKVLVFSIFFITVVSLPLGVMMMFVTTIYINRSKKRRRLIELGFGRNNEWYRGKKMDFFMANFVYSGITFTAWRMKVGLVSKKQKELGAYAFPELHKHNNYNKLLQEFPFFVKWEMTKMAIIFLGLICMALFISIIEK